MCEFNCLTENKLISESPLTPVLIDPLSLLQAYLNCNFLIDRFATVSMNTKYIMSAGLRHCLVNFAFS